MKLIILMDWDMDSGSTKAETYGRHFLNGICAEADSPTAALGALAGKWMEADAHQEMINAIDASDVMSKRREHAKTNG